MATTYTLINSYSVSAGGASNFDFTSIPNTYTDLLFIISARSSVAQLGASLYMRFNGGSTTNTSKNLYGNGTGAFSNASSDAWSGVDVNGANASSGIFSNTQIYIPNYAGSSNKIWSAESTIENNATAAYCEIIAGQWASSTAISRVTFTIENASGNFVQYSSAYLFGIKNS